MHDMNINIFFAGLDTNTDSIKYIVYVSDIDIHYISKIYIFSFSYADMDGY